MTNPKLLYISKLRSELSPQAVLDNLFVYENSWGSNLMTFEDLFYRVKSGAKRSDELSENLVQFQS